MKILLALKTGALRSSKSWKGVLVIWFVSLMLVSMVAFPLRSVVNSDFGRSMITEKLADGLNIEVFTDLGANLKSLISYLSAGFMMIILAGFILNTFFTAGLFTILKETQVDFSLKEFFIYSVKYFLPFLAISLIITLLISVMAVIVIVLPLSFIIDSGSLSQGAVFKAGVLLITFYSFILTILILVADYSRAWQTSKEVKAPLKAIGFGFRQTFRTFLSSFPLMIILLAIQLFYGWMVYAILPGLKPSVSAGVFLLFMFSQILFIIRIFLKTCRYGSITALMELNSLKILR